MHCTEFCKFNTRFFYYHYCWKKLNLCYFHFLSKINIFLSETLVQRSLDMMWDLQDKLHPSDIQYIEIIDMNWKWDLHSWFHKALYSDSILVIVLDRFTIHHHINLAIDWDFSRPLKNVHVCKLKKLKEAARGQGGPHNLASNPIIFVN
jgi:hypothetical protein